ncbi:MAG TPA: hypothetical protein VNT32_15560 [Thermoleophilaceae bacterium]|nr:hypothetical protein [Thermoleophilaceae bacterium]
MGAPRWEDIAADVEARDRMEWAVELLDRGVPLEQLDERHALTERVLRAACRAEAELEQLQDAAVEALDGLPVGLERTPELDAFRAALEDVREYLRRKGGGA